MPQLLLVLVVLRRVLVHLIRPLFAVILAASLRGVKILTLGIDPRREERCRLLMNHLQLRILLRVVQEALAIHTHVVELAVDQDDLPVSQAECLAIYEALDHLQLFDDQSLAEALTVLDGVEELPENVVVEGVLPPLLGPEVQNGAAYLEQVLRDVLALAMELAGLGVDVERALLLVQK